MPVRDFFGVLRRRWLLVLIGFFLTVGVSGAAYELFKPTYEITGTVLLLPPASSAVTGSANPYLQLGGLRQAVDLVGVSLTDQSTQLELQQISKDVDYTVQADVRTSSPLLVIDVKDSSEATALRIRDMLVARVDLRLQAMQAALSVAPKDRVTTTVVTLDAQATEVGKNRLRAAVVAGAGGAAVTLVVATLWDGHRLRHPRTKKKRGRQSPKRSRSATTPTEPVLLEEEVGVRSPINSESPQDVDALEELTDAAADARQ
jgi:uncharacterized protein involved in exopolysaccharide biosynthesis